ncbi:MAG: TrkH family potassium uptake protein, partial [Parachlamydiaceae bacterium]
MIYELLRMSANFFFGFSFILLVPTAVSFYYEFYGAANHPQPHVTNSFLITAGIVFCLGLISHFIGKKGKGFFYKREGIAFVVLIWFITPFLGSLPFTLSGTLDSHLQAYFEAVSGFTTTGSTILHAKSFNKLGDEIKIEKTVPGVIDTRYAFYGTVNPVRDEQGKIILEGIEAVPKALLFWRSFMQWLGGVGVVVLLISILTALGVGGKVLFKSEVPGPVKEG